MRRTALALTIGATLLTAACNRNGLQLAVSNKPANPSLLLSCARSVASERGLGEITQNGDAMELQAKSAVDVASSGSTSYDVLTVKLSPARKGLRMLVGSASYALRQLRSGSVGSAAQRSEWVSTSPSTRVALVRDAVLDQCGTIGD